MCAQAAAAAAEEKKHDGGAARQAGCALSLLARRLSHRRRVRRRLPLRLGNTAMKGSVLAVKATETHKERQCLSREGQWQHTWRKAVPHRLALAWTGLRRQRCEELLGIAIVGLRNGGKGERQVKKRQWKVKDSQWTGSEKARKDSGNGSERPMKGSEKSRKGSGRSRKVSDGGGKAVARQWQGSDKGGDTVAPGTAPSRCPG